MSEENKLKGSGKLFNISGNKLLENTTDQAYGMLSGRLIAKYSGGARCVLKVNDELVGFAFNISWNINTEFKEIMTIDEYVPADMVPTLLTVSGSIGCFHIPGSGPSKKEWAPTLKSFLVHKYISIEARDSLTDELLFYTNKAVITNRSQSMQAGSLSQLQLSFKAIGFVDEKSGPVEGIDAPAQDAGGAINRLGNFF